MAPNPERQILVLPNPYKNVDHLGRPIAVVPWEPDEGGFSSASHRGFVGAKIDIEKTRVLEAFASHDRRSPRQETVYAFNTTEAVAIEASVYYLERIRHGALLAADEKTARLAGVPFESPATVMRRTRDQRAAEWKQNHGTDLPVVEEGTHQS